MLVVFFHEKGQNETIWDLRTRLHNIKKKTKVFLILIYMLCENPEVRLTFEKSFFSLCIYF